MGKVILFLIVLILFSLYVCYIYNKEKNSTLEFITSKSNIDANAIKIIYESIFKEFKIKSGISVLCGWVGCFDKKETLNASSPPKFIIIKATWIEKIVCGDSQWKTAFLHTLGHELGHKKNEPIASIFHSKKGRFKNWVRECRADYYGIQFVQTKYYTSRLDVLKSIRLKINNNAPSDTEKETYDYKHPSWNFRWKIINDHMVFGEDVIRCIATEADYSNNRYIEKLIKKARLNIVTSEEKEEVCRNIHRYINDNLVNLIADELFISTSMECIGEFYYHKIIKEVENATEELINIVIKKVYSSETINTQSGFYLKICEYIGLKRLPRDVLLEIDNEYREVFIDMYSNYIKNHKAAVDNLDTQIKQCEDRIKTNTQTKLNILSDLTTIENKIYEDYTCKKELNTRKEIFEYELQLIKSKLQEFCDLDDEDAINAAKREKALTLCKLTVYDKEVEFGVYREYIEIANDDLERPYTVFFKIKMYPLIEAARKKYFMDSKTNKENATKEYNDTINALPAIDNIYNQKSSDPYLYNQILSKLITDNNIVNEIIECIQKNVCLRNRKSVLIDAIDLFKQGKYDLFNNIIPIQIEGMFADYLYDISTFKRFCKMDLHLDAVLKQKIILLQDVNDDIYPEAVMYFRFYFNNMIRNKVAHGRYSINNDNANATIFANELFLDLNMLVYMISRNSETEKMYRFIHNYQRYYNNLINGSNPCFGALFNDLIGTKTIFTYDKIEKHSPMQIAYWLLNPHYEGIYKKVANDNSLIDLRNVFLSLDFWEYTNNKLDEVINTGYDYLNISKQSISVVNALFRCNVPDNVKNRLIEATKKLNYIMNLKE